MLGYKDQRGISFIDALLALGCVSILFAASSNFILQARKNTKILHQMSVRNKTQSTLKMVLDFPTAIRVSHNRPGNEELLACLLPQIVFDPTITGGDCNHARLTPFILFGPMVAVSGGMESLSGELAGKEGNPVEYNSLGAARDIGAGEPTAMKVKSWFRPYCPPMTLLGPSVAVCDVAEFFEFIFEIESVVDDPALPKLRTIRESVFISGEEISALLPAINFKFVPPAPPVPPPPPLGGGGGGGGGVVVPPSPVVCPGNTIQTGTNRCSCPAGYALVDPRAGRCLRVAR